MREVGHGGHTDAASATRLARRGARVVWWGGFAQDAFTRPLHENYEADADRQAEADRALVKPSAPRAALSDAH